MLFSLRFAAVTLFAVVLGVQAAPSSSIDARASTRALEPLPAFPKTFHNPIKGGTGADPWVVHSKTLDSWFLCHSAGGGVKVTPTRNLAWFNSGNGTVVWKPPKTLKNLWAPELHWLDGSWYIYVAMDDGDNKNHRMYVLKGTDPVDPTKPFNLVGKINSPDDNWAIDGTVMTYQPNGKRYFIWSGWPHKDAGFPQNLYIAQMCSPTKICSNRALLHEPTRDWQKSQGKGVNEGPQILRHKGTPDRWFIVYSAAGSWGDDYSLALMGIDKGKDPMKKANWWALDDRPVMWRNDAAGVFGPGHASFTLDRKGTPYIIYHATNKTGSGWSGRTIRTEPFKWNKDGSPWFPRPRGFEVAQPQPQ